VGARYDEKSVWESLREAEEAAQRGDDVRYSRLVEDRQCLSQNLSKIPSRTP